MASSKTFTAGAKSGDTIIESLPIGVQPIAGSVSVTTATNDPSLVQGDTALNQLATDRAANASWQSAMKTDSTAIIAKLDAVGIKAGTNNIGSVNIALGGNPNSDTNPIITKANPPSKLNVSITEPTIAQGGNITLPAKAGRASLGVQNNNTTGFIRVKIGGTASATVGQLFLPGGGYDWPDRQVPEGIISIYSSVAGTVYLTEGAVV